MISVDAPLPEFEDGTRKPFVWTTLEDFLKDKGISMEEYKKCKGLDDESKRD